MDKIKKINWKKEALYWLGIAGVLGLLYVTGWHTQVAGKLQQAILWTGIMQPETEMADSEKVNVDYDMPLVEFDGDATSLEEFKGKVIFMNFWATWCPPCIAEMPNIQELYNGFEGREDIIFIMVNLDEDINKAKEFLVKNDYTFGSYKATGKVPVELRSSVIPTTVVINKEGKLAAKKRGMANYNTVKFRSFLKSLIKN